MKPKKASRIMWAGYKNRKIVSVSDSRKFLKLFYDDVRKVRVSEI
jgi:hypothetical protein